MVLSKKNMIVYTIQLDTDEVRKIEERNFDLIGLFKREFQKEGLAKEATRMEKGGFSYRERERNTCFIEYEISITTRTSIL